MPHMLRQCHPVAGFVLDLSMRKHGEVLLASGMERCPTTLVRSDPFPY